MQYVPLWTTILRSRKVFSLDDASFRFWVNCLALAQDHDQRNGGLPDLDSISFSLRMEEEEAAELMGRLVAAGLIDEDGTTCVIHNWRKWRYKPDATQAERKRNQRNRERANVTNVTDVTRDIGSHESHAIQNSTEAEQKAGKPAVRTPAREAVPEIVPIRKSDPEWEPQPLPDESMTGRSGQDHADLIRAIQILDGHQTTRRLGAELRMYVDTPALRNVHGWQMIVGAMTAQRPDKGKTWGGLMAFARNATQSEFDKLNAQAPARIAASGLPSLSDEKLRAQTEEANRKVAEYRRKRAQT